MDEYTEGPEPARRLRLALGDELETWTDVDLPEPSGDDVLWHGGGKATEFPDSPGTGVPGEVRVPRHVPIRFLIPVCNVSGHPPGPGVQADGTWLGSAWQQFAFADGEAQTHQQENPSHGGGHTYVALEVDGVLMGPVFQD